MKTTELENKILELIQNEFDLFVKPDIKKWMENNNCNKIEFSMGSVLFTFKNGDRLLDDEICEISKEYSQFYKDYIDLLTFKSSLVNFVDFDITLNS